MEPRQPSASTVTGAWISTPGVKFGPGLPSRSSPMSPMRTPFTAPFSSNSAAAAAKPGNTSTPRLSAFCASHGVSCPSEMM